MSAATTPPSPMAINACRTALLPRSVAACSRATYRPALIAAPRDCRSRNALGIPRAQRCLGVTHPSRSLAKLLRYASAGLFAVLLGATAGCKPLTAPTKAQPAKVSDDTVSVSTDSVNYMQDRGLQYTLYDLSKMPPVAVGGAIVYMLGTGGEKGCCIALPKVWRPGIKLRLAWHEEDRDNIFPAEYSREMEIPHYDEPSDLYVVFYPKQEVELVVSVGEPGDPEWRGRIKDTPWEACLAANPRKVCKAALPKQFDTKSSQGACTYLKAENVLDADSLCLVATVQCMRDFEDEPFCKKILWGPINK